MTATAIPARRAAEAGHECTTRCSFPGPSCPGRQAPRPALLAVLPGQRIVAVNGERLPFALVVEEVVGNSVRVTPPHATSVEWRLYADQHKVEVEAAAPVVEPVVEPAPAKPARPAVRVVAGVRLVSQGGGTWQSEDGAYGVQREAAPTFCEDEHPVRITRSLIEWAKANPNDARAADVLWALRCDKRGYVCPGNEEHTYDVWTSWAGGDGKWTDTIADSMEEALSVLREAIER